MYKYSITPSLLKLIKEIHMSAVRLKANRPNQVVLLSLETEALSLSSYSSTSIEGNPLPLTEVRKILKTRPNEIRNTEREILQYNDILIQLNKAVLDEAFELTEKTIVQTHKNLMKDLLPKVKLGSFRKEAVVVNDPKSRKAIFYPPDHIDVKKHMSDLLDFIKAEKSNLDPLILAGIFHKQFVLIHPFIDGNGRLVRLLTKTLLAEFGLNIFSLFSFESYYNKNITSYFKKVGERGDYYDIIKKVDFTEWLEYFCEGVLDELLRVEKILQQKKISTPSDTLSSEQNKILIYLSDHEFIRDVDYAKLTSRAKATRALDFKKLTQLNYIEKKGKGPATYYRLKK